MLKLWIFGFLNFWSLMICIINFVRLFIHLILMNIWVSSPPARLNEFIREIEGEKKKYSDHFQFFSAARVLIQCSFHSSSLFYYFMPYANFPPLCGIGYYSIITIKYAMSNKKSCIVWKSGLHCFFSAARESRLNKREKQKWNCVLCL